MKIVINGCYGGFGLSDAAYEKMAEWGVSVRKYGEQANDGEVIFDRELTPEGEDRFNDIYHKYKGKTKSSQRYWDTWTSDNRAHPLIVRLVEEMGEVANGPYAQLRIVEVPDGVEWEIDEYDGIEHIAETHRTWS